MIDSVSVKRVYDPAEPGDGHRVLVDGLWPRGIRRDQIPEGSWIRQVAPTTELRNWYRHNASRFGDFAERYRAELALNADVDKLFALDGHLTLVTAVRDVEISHAAVLRDYLLERLGG